MGLQARWFANHGQEGARLLCARGERFAQGGHFSGKRRVREKAPLIFCDDPAHDKFAITSAS